MVKIRKQRPGEPIRDRAFIVPERNPHPCAVVRHVKLSLQIDVRNHRLHGYAELKVVAPTKGVIGLHAQGLTIVRVLYDGTPTTYEVLQGFESNKFEATSCTRAAQKLPASSVEAAEESYAEYLGALERESHPELLVFAPEVSIASGENHDIAQTLIETGINEDTVTLAEKTGPEYVVETKKEEVTSHTEEVNVVHVEYWLEKPAAGVHFFGNMLHTSGQLRRARCWFPCVDLDFQRCSYEMEFTVDSQCFAVSSGKLQFQVINKEDENLRTFVYKLDTPVAAKFISLVVAPLELHPDRQNASISHFCFHNKAYHLQCTVNFFNLVFSFYEDYLGASFPFGSYSHVFLDSEFLTTSLTVGAAMTIVSSHLLVDDRIIDQTMNTRIKLVHALAQQWFGVYISPESPDDGWLLEGLCFFLTDMFIKRHFGNNESYFRRFKANEAICKADTEDAPPLSPRMNLFGTQKIGALGHIHSWKAIAVIQMLEKQMGPEAFRKILQRVVLRVQDPVRNSRTLSTKEFRHFANRLGNLERPFLKEFFPRWVESPGCPLLRMGFEYSKRRNVIELAVRRECTASCEMISRPKNDMIFEQRRSSDVGWPGMMSIRVHETDGMYDHPILSMAGDTYQLLEIQCHSKLAGKKIQRPKKGAKGDAEDMETFPATDARSNTESPLLWLRADPQMEYLAEIHLHQPEQMWINQIEKDRDVVAQSQAITALASIPEMSFGAANALCNCLVDSKVFYRVRIEAACALANAIGEVNGGTRLSRILGFYKSQRYDPDVGLPRPNDFHDFADYFVLQAIPDIVSSMRGPDGRSPPEVVEFILQLLKHNDNCGNHYSDVFWVCSIIRSIGKLEFGEQNLEALSRMLKRIDRFLQTDRIMPSYNYLLTISCVQALTKVAMRFSALVPMEKLESILAPLKDSKTMPLKVRAVVLQSLLELRVHMEGLDAGINLALELAEADLGFKVQTKLFAYILNVVILMGDAKQSVETSTLSRLMLLLQSQKAFNNTTMRHYIFCILQVLGGRPGTLFRVGRPDAVRKVIETIPKPVAPMQPIAIPEVKVSTSTIKVRLQQPPPAAPVEPAVQLDKLNDPEYQEWKRLKKEKRKEQQQEEELKQEEKQEKRKEQQQQQPLETKHEPEKHEEETEKPLDLDTSNVAGTESLQAKPTTSGAEKAVVRLKIKLPPQPQVEPVQEQQLPPGPAASRPIESDVCGDESARNAEPESGSKAGGVETVQPRPPMDKVFRLKVKRP